MTTLIFEPSKDYLLHVTVEPTDSPPDSVHVKIESQWLRAKDPHGLQTRYRGIFSKKDAIKLAAELINPVK